MQTGLGLLGAGSNYASNAGQMFGQGSTYAGMGLNAATTAAGLNQGIDSNMLNTAMTNASINNRATEFGIQGDWTTKSYNQTRNDSFNNQLLTGGLALGLAPFTGGASLGMFGMGGGSSSTNTDPLTGMTLPGF